jgi:hypothetical protein
MSIAAYSRYGIADASIVPLLANATLTRQLRTKPRNGMMAKHALPSSMYPSPLRGGQGHGFIPSTLLSRRHRLGARNARLTAKLAVTAS